MADSDTEEIHLDVTIFVDKKKSRVLFAEADGYFVDILFSFLTLPLGTIIRLIGKTKSEPATVGCLCALYRSVTSLGREHFYHGEYKNMLLHPRSSSEVMCQKLKINIDDTVAKCFLCPNYSLESTCSNFMSLYENTKCPGCRRRTMHTVKSSRDSFKTNVFVARGLKFIITDDLQVTPVVPGTVIDLLDNLGINDLSVIEERTVNVGLNEFLELLKLTLLSTTPLTDVFLSKEKLSVPKKKSVQKRQCVDHLRGDRKIDVEVVLKKSNKELLFVEAHQDFIDFLFSFLVIPLGQVLHIMEGQSCMGSIDGLYKSAQSLDSRYFPYNTRNILLRPKLAPHFHSTDHLLPLESTPVTCYIDGANRTMPIDAKLCIIGGSKGFLKEEAVFLVHDNLAVTPYSAASAISVFKRNKISVSDLERRTLSLGLAEAISILRASLTSSAAISNGPLHNSNLIFKAPKHEK